MCFFISSQPKLCFRCCFVCLCWDPVLRGCVTSICAFSYPVIPNCVLGAVLFVCVGIEFYEAASLVYVLFHIQSDQTVF